MGVLTGDRTLDALRYQLASASPLAQTVYEELRRQILSGELSPGTQLPEVDLAKSMKISRTPVREALRRLCDEGLVECRHRWGARVSEVSLREALEVYEIRELAEPGAARRAAQNLTPEQAQQLGKLHAQVVQSPMTDLVLRQQLDWNVHDFVLEAAGNELLRRWIWSLRVRTERAFAYVADDQLEERRQEHLELLDAIGRRDGEAAEQSMRRHLHLARLRLTRINWN